MRMRFLLLAALPLALAGCFPGDTQLADAKRALRMQAPTLSVQSISHDFWNMSCSKGDDFAYKFRGVDTKTGEAVSGQVCGGWFKGNTIRWD